jgi:hypothetical protein
MAVVAFTVKRTPPAVAPVTATGRLMVASMVALVVAATGRLRVVAMVVAATGRLQVVAPLAALGSVVGVVAEAVNPLGGVPPRLPLLQRSGRAMRLPPQRMLSILHVPALPVLDRLLHRPVPGAATLDGRRSFAQLPRPLGPQQLGRAGVGALAPGLHAQQLAPLLCQVGAGLLVGLVVLLPVARVAFAVGAARSAACRATW